MTESETTVPTSIRRLDSDDAGRLVKLVEAYDELQTVLHCCERLVSLLSGDTQDADATGIEALWTLALLSYARAFGAGALTEDDLADGAAPEGGAPTGGPGASANTAGDSVKWHRVLLHLRDYHSDPATNPRETYTVGVATDGGDGAVNAVAVTSVRAPLVDAAAVRKAGAIVFPLCGVLDERIGALQESILSSVRDLPREQLAAMDLIEVASPA
jgi:hypothetical protein